MSKKSGGCIGSILFLILGGQFGCIGLAIAIIVLGVVAYLAVKAIIVIVKVLLIVGALVGLVITIRNYALALYHNIKPEKVTP